MSFSSPTRQHEDSGQAAVKVYVRVRPFVERELSNPAEGPSPTLRVSADNNQQITVLDPLRAFLPKETFNFDHCFWSVGDHAPSSPAAAVEVAAVASSANSSFDSFSRLPSWASQEAVFNVVGSDALKNSFDGFNSCIFAYGQTGSGKTFTMMGDASSETQRGLIPRIGLALFESIRDQRAADASLSFRVECGYFEVYNERVFDLLQPGLEDLRVRQDPITGPYVEGLSWRHVSAAQTILDLIGLGNCERHTAATKMNDRSSRSHAILCIMISQLRLHDDGSSTRCSSKLNLVDLAGSERTTASGVEGVAFKEATKINLSLTTLGRVIDALSDHKNSTRPPYRESLLTWLLMDSLGGNSKTAMIATLSPSALHYDEMLNTLRYACRAREIVNIVVINEDPSVRKIKELQNINERLRKQVMVLQSHRVTPEQLAEAETKLSAANKRNEDLRTELTTAKATISMRDASLANLRQELSRRSNESPVSPAGTPPPAGLPTFSRSHSHHVPDTASFRRTNSLTSALPHAAKRAEESATIENLRARIDALEQENKKLKSASDKHEPASPTRTSLVRRPSAVVRPSIGSRHESPTSLDSSVDADDAAALLKKKDLQLVEATRRAADSNRHKDQIVAEYEARIEALKAEHKDQVNVFRQDRVAEAHRHLLTQLTSLEKRTRDELAAMERRFREESTRRSQVNSALRRDFTALVEATHKKTLAMEAKTAVAIEQLMSQEQSCRQRDSCVLDCLRKAEATARRSLQDTESFAGETLRDVIALRVQHSLTCNSEAMELREMTRVLKTELFEKDELIASLSHMHDQTRTSLCESESLATVLQRNYDALAHRSRTDVTLLQLQLQEDRVRRQMEHDGLQAVQKLAYDALKHGVTLMADAALTQLSQKLAEATERLREAEQRLEGAHSTAAQEISEVKEAHAKTVAELTAEYKRALAAERTAYEKIVAALVAEHDARAAELTAAHERALAATQEELAAEKAAHEKSVAALAAEHDARAAELTAAHERALAATQEELAAEQSAHRASIAAAACTTARVSTAAQASLSSFASAALEMHADIGTQLLSSSACFAQQLRHSQIAADEHQCRRLATMKGQVASMLLVAKTDLSKSLHTLQGNCLAELRSCLAEVSLADAVRARAEFESAAVASLYDLFAAHARDLDELFAAFSLFRHQRTMAEQFASAHSAALSSLLELHTASLGDVAEAARIDRERITAVTSRKSLLGELLISRSSHDDALAANAALEEQIEASEKRSALHKVEYDRDISALRAAAEGEILELRAELARLQAVQHEVELLRADATVSRLEAELQKENSTPQRKSHNQTGSSGEGGWSSSFWSAIGYKNTAASVSQPDESHRPVARFSRSNTNNTSMPAMASTMQAAPAPQRPKARPVDNRTPTKIGALSPSAYRRVDAENP